MKVTIISLLCLLQALAVFSQEEKEFTIHGKFPTSYYDGLTIYLNEIDYKDTNSVFKRDSAIVAGDKFTFTGNLEKPISMRYITLPDNQDLTALIVLEKGTINLEMSEVPTMSGTVKNNELSDFTKTQIENRKELESILQKAQDLHKIGTLDEATSTKLEQDFNDQRTLMQKQVYDFVSKNILNEMGEFFFTIYPQNFGTNQLEALYVTASQEFQKGVVVKSIMNQHVWSLGNLREGKKLNGIDMKNMEGTIENISKHFGNGKVVLVDFWASWCAPCIKTMPAVVKLYDRYKESGFEIVGISLDSSESAWKGAVNRLRMEWPQYIDDGGGWNGGAAKEYNITRIPQTYLLDKEGKIAGHDLAGVDLINKIEELLTKE